MPKLKNPTEKQIKFKEFLLDEGNPKTFGNPYAAKVAAGYGPNTATRDVIDGLQDELIETINNELLLSAIKSAKALTEIVDNPTQLGATNKQKAADSILDRAGVIKKSQIEVSQTSPTTILVLPGKEVSGDDDAGGIDINDE
jgi:hypothetical protein